MLASYLAHADAATLTDYLEDTVFAAASVRTADPNPADVAGFTAYLDRYRAGLVIEAAAIDTI